MTDFIRVLVVDDHPVVREGLRSFLGSREGIEVVGEAGDRDDALVRAGALRPDVVLLDLMMPGGGGIAALPGLLALDPAPRVIVLTSFGADDQVLAAVRGGASGWLGKDVPPSELESAIRTVHRGGSVLDPAVAGRVLAEVARPGTHEGHLEQLTTREREVLALLGEGLSNRELAARLFVAEKTVKTHVSAILSKLHLADRTQAALFAVRHGLVEEPGPQVQEAQPEAAGRPMAPTWALRTVRDMTTTASTAIITGASRGLGLALARSLAEDGWALVVDGRDARSLADAIDPLEPLTTVVPVVGDITDDAHRADLAIAAQALGGIGVLVLNAGTLGPSPLPPLSRLRLGDLRTTLETNVVAQLGVVQALLPHLRPGATVVAITSDAAVEPYEGWGAYATSKAGFEQLAAILGSERPDLRVLRIDPGDMRTQMHQDAFPDEDISDRPGPEEAVPGLRGLIEGPFPSGRYRVADVPAPLEVA